MESKKKDQNRKSESQLKNFWQFISSVGWFISAYIALGAFVLIKNFAFDVVRVNSRDMEPSLHYGEAVLISKSFNTLAVGDVVYYRHPSVDSSLLHCYMTQRVMALPGDVFEIRAGEVLVNDEKIQFPFELKQNYFVSAVQALDSLLLEEFQIRDGGLVSSNFDYSFALTDSLVPKLKNHPYIKSVERRMEKAGRYDENCFPFHPFYAWNSDHFGKLRIPRENDTLQLDTAGIAIYLPLIREHEKNDLRISGDSIFINGELTHQYIVKKNYYFVLGDNRGNANDSRNWGYLPENMIIGKVQKKLRTMP
jgi:signal peptidase I